MSPDAAKTKLTFAKVAASANASLSPNPSPRGKTVTQRQVAVPLIKSGANVATEKPSKDADLTHQESVSEAEKYTPRPSKSTLVPVLLCDELLDEHPRRGGLGPEDAIRAGAAAPVSEENVTKLSSLQSLPSSLSMDGKSNTSGTTFPLDEKESLRPDDSASVKANEEDDGLDSTQPSSQVGSDTDARAFSEQLREISIMGPPTRQPAAIARLDASAHSTPGALFSPSPIAVPKAFAGVSAGLSRDANSIPFSPDEKLLEALSSVRDRVWVLKLEQDITDFVKDPLAQSFDLPQCNSFYRMLAHKMADYYLLGHTMDASLSTVRLWKTPSSRIRSPPRLSDVTNPSTAASTPPPPLPQMKILRRNDTDTRPSSCDGVVDGDSGSDVGKNKFPATREEREARYEAARLRILGSAKPTEDAVVAPPKEPDGSNSNSVVGKRKNRKQRSDSEDGFEARSAYSMYPQGGMQPNVQPDVHAYNPQSDNMPPMQYGPQMQFGMPNPYANGYRGPPQAPQPFYNGGYGAMPPQQPPMWNPDPYNSYDMTGHMQAMSFQPQGGGMGTYPNQMGGSVTGSPNYSHPTMMNGYNNYVQQPIPYHYGGPAGGQPGFSATPPYQFGMLPGQSFNGGKRQNPNHPLPGSYNRPFFNPNSQAFVPGRPSSPYNRPNYAGSISPAVSHASAANVGLQRQHSPHSPHSYGGPPGQHTPMQHLPVFAQPSPPHAQPRSSPAQQANGVLTPPKMSTLAKYARASLPAKPPPPADGSIRMQQYPSVPAGGGGQNGSGVVVSGKQ
ncbi:hypothetical protein ANO11243_009050 [Dothideomycetidae sp. 11243]|nr:hypothetical protein ANO11243_009050 [fungal sp. No.11243]